MVLMKSGCLCADVDGLQYYEHLARLNLSSCRCESRLELFLLYVEKFHWTIYRSTDCLDMHVLFTTDCLDMLCCVAFVLLALSKV
jgi:hypothetical protein